MDFQKTILDHYKKHGRSLPWRETIDPYKIIVSEIMLQQTQVPRVIEKYKQFISAFPDFDSLAKAPLQKVLAIWQGLGYNRRAVSLKRTAEIVVEKYNGRLPDNPEELTSLPGIGKATAASICAFAFNKPVVFIETNIRSVFIYHFFKNKKKISDEQLLPLVKKYLYRKNPRMWYWALMDYGSMLKKSGNPSRKSKHHVKQSTFEGSNRQLRGQIVKLLITKPMTEAELRRIVKRSVKQNLMALQKDGLIKQNKNKFTV